MWEKKPETLREKILAKFPERQVYFRTNGVVRFISIAPWFQMTMVAALFGCLVWVGVTTVHFLSRDLILEEREETIRVMADQYETIADDMTSLQQQVLQRASQIEQRQKYLESLLGTEALAQNNNTAEAIDAVEAIDAMPDADTPVATEDTAIETLPTEGEEPGLFEDLLVSDDDAEEKTASVSSSEDFSHAILARLEVVDHSQQRLAQHLLEYVESQFQTVDAEIKDTGLNTSTMIANWTGSNPAATGGPFVPAMDLAPLPGETIEQDSFLSLSQQINTRWRQLARLTDALDSMPAGDPAERYYVSSRFGPRTDPLRGVAAIHPGLDMSGWPGTSIQATAGGTIVKAGTWGPYGKMVEIDHGNGFKTRYGHMSKINVQRGDVVARGQEIGEMGCTGRCTGTHLHYEVWYQNQLKDPFPFLKVSENVLEIER